LGRLAYAREFQDGSVAEGALRKHLEMVRILEGKFDLLGRRPFLLGLNDGFVAIVAY
jgi:hypothetical protein